MLLYLLLMVGLFGMFFIFFIYIKSLNIYVDVLVCIFMLIKLRDLFFDEFVFSILGIIVLIVR